MSDCISEVNDRNRPIMENRGTGIHSGTGLRDPEFSLSQKVLAE